MRKKAKYTHSERGNIWTSSHDGVYPWSMLSRYIPYVRRVCYHLFWTVFHTRSQQAPLMLTQPKTIAACLIYVVSDAYNLHTLLWKFKLRPSPSLTCLKLRQRSSSTQQIVYHPPSWYQDCGIHISHCHIMPNLYYELANVPKRWWRGWLHHHPQAPRVHRNIVKNTHILPEHFNVLTFQWFMVCFSLYTHARTACSLVGTTWCECIHGIYRISIWR